MQLTVTRPDLRREHRGATVYNDDVIRPLDNPIYAEGALAVLNGNLAPDGCVMKPSACEPRLRRHSGPALVFDDYPSDEGRGRPRRSRRHAGSRPGAAQRRAAGRAGHAGMGHAADPEEAAEAGRARHGAHLRRAHERHQLWRLHPACRAGGLCRRAAGAGAQRRPHLRRRPGAPHRPAGVAEETWPPQGRLVSRRRRASSAAFAPEMSPSWNVWPCASAARISSSNR